MDVREILLLKLVGSLFILVYMDIGGSFPGNTTAEVWNWPLISI